MSVTTNVVIGPGRSAMNSVPTSFSDEKLAMAKSYPPSPFLQGFRRNDGALRGNLPPELIIVVATIAERVRFPEAAGSV